MSCSAQLSESIFISLILGVHVEDEKGRMILPSSKELPRMTQLPDRIVNLGNESAKFSRSVAFPSQHELYMTNVPSVCFFSCLERHRSVLCCQVEGCKVNSHLLIHPMHALPIEADAFCRARWQDRTGMSSCHGGQGGLECGGTW
ncbi:hypothetical protein MGG_18042 [Pyricularia oryzae 70-15]|uniref:Uncharacterized protein n=4 Tax=Pyricularia oryzae TaxID=318829 RepID=G5EHI1_PYRO7|nr:uncharacterized protein MGG_18042 [Pyricularia oryzae 70-15]AEX97147.1 hypothetical protein 7bg7.12 [Pyricularia oryzae]EAQ70815.1 hypothetical protein MGCH7_ch7g222 [Pyricularia oryzae 70-15]EHA46545.1 hypothetical protein MGG_18042 [Pyricularia oryzae 70-15]ELQ40554.1 hypothetical protein OOU_Y34scaffold00420g9 [Pyricularia oryzae Y34]